MSPTYEQLGTAKRKAFSELRAREKILAARFTDPYGTDNYAYDRAKQDDPEWVRLRSAFREARRVWENAKP